MASFGDPDVPPPADISGADARRYEEVIVDLIRAALPPGSDPIRKVTSIELRGEQPNTEILFRYTDVRKPGKHAVRFRLWDDIDRDLNLLPDPRSMAGWIYSDWLAGELDPDDSAE